MGRTRPLRHLFGEGTSGDWRSRSGTPSDPIADATLLALQHHAMRPTPEAYTLWYRHSPSERPDLSKRRKDFEARSEAVLFAERFERLLRVEPAAMAIADVSGAIEQLLAASAGNLVADSDAAERGGRLARLGARLGPATMLVPAPNKHDLSWSLLGRSPQTVRRANAGLVEEIRSMRPAVHRLQHRVIESTGKSPNSGHDRGLRHGRRFEDQDAAARSASQRAASR